MAARAAAGLMGRARTSMDADVSILRSKITMPAVPDWAVPRPRLDQLIAGGVQGPLTALMGPPGIGKTLAMASWAAGNQASSPVAWVTLDEFDNRPGGFWPYVVAALRGSGVATATTLPAAARGRDPGLPGRCSSASGRSRRAAVAGSGPHARTTDGTQPFICPVRGTLSTSSRCGGPAPGPTGWLPTSSR